VVLRLAAFVLPLGLDSFAIAAALGAAGMTAQQRWRISVLFVAFEGGMPLVGLAAGAPLAHAIGHVADYLAAGVLMVLGGWLLLHDDDDDEAAKAGQLSSARGLAVIGLGVSISLDELAVGFSLGLTHLPVAAVIAAIAIQALIATQLGLHLGARIGERIREGAERLAGVALLLLGLYLLIARLTGHNGS
jgi:putative Mn2+ efflux pump MntP